MNQQLLATVLPRALRAAGVPQWEIASLVLAIIERLLDNRAAYVVELKESE